MSNKFKNKKGSLREHRVNDEIYGNYDVRVVYPTNYDSSDIRYYNLNFTSEIMNLNDAKNLANKLNLDIFEINPNLNPPIIRIDNYDKWLYREKKKQKENKQNKFELKEVQLSTNISKHDLEIKAKKTMEFIADGDKVKVVLTMKNRELSRREESKRCLYEFILMVKDVATPESMLRDEGTKSIVILKKKK